MYVFICIPKIPLENDIRIWNSILKKLLDLLQINEQNCVCSYSYIF